MTGKPVKNNCNTHPKDCGIAGLLPRLSSVRGHGRLLEMRITLLPQNRTMTFAKRMSVASLLNKLDLLPGTVMVIRDAALLTDDEVIQVDDEIEIRSVISGGL